MSRGPRCVIDTNVLISAALAPRGTPRRVVEWVIQHGRILLSDPTLDELSSRFVPRAKFDSYLSAHARRAFVAEIVAASEQVAVTSRLAVCSDPDDDRFLELALDGRADAVVTGNTRDFPPEHEGIPVLTPAAFVRRYFRVELGLLYVRPCHPERQRRISARSTPP